MMEQRLVLCREISINCLFLQQKLNPEKKGTLANDQGREGSLRRGILHWMMPWIDNCRLHTVGLPTTETCKINRDSSG